MSAKMLWNKDRTAFVPASKIREIVLYPDRYSGDTSVEKHAEVKGWYNSEEYFDFGWFATTEEAKEFMDTLQIRMEN